MNFLNAIPFDTLLWFVPFLLMLHNMEEAPSMDKWAERLPVKIKLIESKRQFVIAVIILTLIGFFLTYFGLQGMAEHGGHILILSMLITMTLNVFFPHLLLAIRFRMYNPGLVTALVLILPYSIYMFQRALNENLLVRNEFWLLLGISPLIMLAAIFISLKLGQLFS
jgi:hypothetical protein